MAIIKKKELKSMSSEDLNKRLNEIRLELSKESANIAVGMPKNPGKVREMKKTIAKILTYQKNHTDNLAQRATAEEDVKK